MAQMIPTKRNDPRRLKNEHCRVRIIKETPLHLPMMRQVVLSKKPRYFPNVFQPLLKDSIFISSVTKNMVRCQKQSRGPEIAAKPVRADRFPTS